MIHWIKKHALEIYPDVITKMFQNLEAKIHKVNENGLKSLLWYVTYPSSINYEIIITIIVSNSLKFELVQFFLDQTLSKHGPILKILAFSEVFFPKEYENTKAGMNFQFLKSVDTLGTIK